MPQSPDPAAKPERGPERPGMVDWYSVPELAATGARTLMSTLLGSMIDARRILAADGEAADCVFDYSEQAPDQPPRKAACEAPFTFDYLADTGDGWDSTYSMAYLITCPRLEVDGEPDDLERAEIAILGGDEVYPVASKRAYWERLQHPFDTAADNVRRDLGRSRLAINDLYMIPGNHDWYDSLQSMSRRFFSYEHPGFTNKFGRPRKARRLGQFRTRQARSYFVLKLPRQWEIWGVDIQLGEDIDTQQRAFFARHAESIGPKTKVLLCCAVPTIAYARTHEQSALTFGLDRIRSLAYGKGARTYAHIAGDIHNYQHYVVAEETKDKQAYQRHHIGCGGGGAFLHPTHSFYRGPDRVEPVARYPSRDQSRKLSRRIPLFVGRHPGMSALIGALYTAMFWHQGPPGPSLTEMMDFPIQHPVGLLLAALILWGGAQFAGAGRRLWGLLHGAAHVGMALVSWRLGGLAAGLIAEPALQDAVERLTTLAAGSLLGGSLFGLYLYASLNWLRSHHNEAFSTLAWPHHKSLLRCTVETDGSLTVRVLGVERTAGEDGEHPVKTHLIEKFSVGSAGESAPPTG